METVKPRTRGERIKALRKAHRLTLQQLADKLGVTKAACSKWEQTASPDVALTTFFKMADLFKVDPRELALGEQGKHANPTKIPSHRVGLIEKYGELPNELRMNIRGLIETLAAAQSERYATWSMERDKEAKKRPLKKPDTAESTTPTQRSD